MITERYNALFQDEAQTKAIAKRILKEGCVVLPDFFDQATTDALYKYSRSLKDEERFTITRRSGTPAMNVASSPEFMRVFESIHKARCKIQGTHHTPLDPTQQAVSLPIASASNTSDPVPFHFDDSFINAVLAIKMPPNSGDGNLLIYNNLRGRVRPLFLSKVVARLLRHLPGLRAIIRPKEISYQEGALHIFFGDLTLHGVRPFSAGERVTFTINASRVVRPPN